MLAKQTRGRMLLLWGVIPVVAIAEIVLQWQIPRAEPSEDEWAEAGALVQAEKREDDLVVIAPSWASQGRMYLKGAISKRDFGRFDTSRYGRIVEVSVGDARAPETEGLRVVSENDLGRIRVTTYKTPAKAQVIYDFVDHFRRAQARGAKKITPRLFNDHWFFPRLIIPMTIKAKPVSLIYKDVPLGGVIHGYGIVEYRSGRFDPGGPVEFSVYVNDDLVGRQEINNMGPLEEFNFPTPEGISGTVRFEVKASSPKKRKFGFFADMRSKGGVPQ